MATIPTQTRFPTTKQIPDHSIMDHFNKQTYLGNQYSYAATVAISGTSEVPILLLNNPAGNAVSLFVNMTKLAAITAGDTAIMRVYSGPTVTTSGTAQSALNMRPASGNVASGVITSSPTVSANGTLVDMIACAALSNDQSDWLIVLDPGQSLLVTAQVSASSSIIGKLGWYEL